MEPAHEWKQAREPKPVSGADNPMTNRTSDGKLFVQNGLSQALPQSNHADQDGLELGKMGEKWMSTPEVLTGSTQHRAPPSQRTSCWDTSKGEASCIFTFVVMLVGIVLTEGSLTRNLTYEYVLAFGLFGFAGGATNWLAVKMLFDRIPFLAGSGVIPRQFKAIRQSVKDTVMQGFFDEEYLEAYLRKRSATMMQDLDLAKMIDDFMAKPEFDALLTEKLTAMSAKPEGMMINSMAPMFGGIGGMVPVIKPILQAIGKEVGEELARTFDPLEVITVAKIRTELDALMTEKLQLLTPKMVKRLLENVIRQHLGWLVVWGNVFGALIGVVSKIVGYGK